VGAWSCVIYGHPAFGDERMLFHFGADGSAQLAREVEQKISAWTPMSHWTARRRRASAFSDPHTRPAISRRPAARDVGGSWRAFTLIGGWWCSELDGAAVPAVEKLEPLAVMPPLNPSVTSTPQYPLQAIRDAKQAGP